MKSVSTSAYKEFLAACAQPGLVALTPVQLQPQYLLVKRDLAFEVGNSQRNVTNQRTGMN